MTNPNTAPALLALLLTGLTACTPTVQVAMPSEPITINLNVRIEHEIRVRVEEELDDMFNEDSGLF
ncbi:MAG: YnbE family lipoprotein [Pseudohongiellaceae bacterium]